MGSFYPGLWTTQHNVSSVQAQALQYFMKGGQNTPQHLNSTLPTAHSQWKCTHVHTQASAFQNQIMPSATCRHLSAGGRPEIMNLTTAMASSAHEAFSALGMTTFRITPQSRTSWITLMTFLTGKNYIQFPWATSLSISKSEPDRDKATQQEDRSRGWPSSATSSTISLRGAQWPCPCPAR